MDTNFIVSVISVSCAAISPIVLTILNHRHETKVKSEESKLAIAQSVEIELYQARMDTFKNLLKTAGEYLSSIDTAQEQICYGKIVSSIGEASLYCSDFSAEPLENFNQSAESLFSMKSTENYENFSKALNALRLALKYDLCAGKKV